MENEKKKKRRKNPTTEPEEPQTLNKTKQNFHAVITTQDDCGGSFLP